MPTSTFPRQTQPKPVLFVLTLGILLLLAGPIRSQSFSGNAVAIPDSGDVRLGISVTGLANLLGTSFGLEQVCFNIIHPDVSTLHLILVSPSGREVELATPIDRSGPNYNNTCLRGDVNNIVHNASPPYTGTYRAEGQLGEVNVLGESGDGTWIVLIQDTKRDGNTGNCTVADLTFGGNPAQVFKLISSSLPIIVINTRGRTIPDDPKIPARLGIVDNGRGNINLSSGPYNSYWGEMGIELRGNSSQEFPKKPYSMELWDTTGTELNRSLLGMPAESDWLLIPNYSDKTMLRNALTYDLSRKMGQYAARSRYVEVILNGRYQGVYQFMERLKRGASRVDISRLRATDTTGADVTGGYIVKLDKLDSANVPGWYSQFQGDGRTDFPFFQYEYPKAEDILPKQAAYIKGYIDSMETAMMGPNFADVNSGYAKYIDVNSFIDFQVMQELGKNVDGYRFSTYLHKLKITRGNKLRMGPIWDLDIAYGNLNFSFGPVTRGWRYEEPTTGQVFPAWWHRLATDSNYVRQRRCRWINLRQNVLDTFRLARVIDSCALAMGPAIGRNYSWWTTLGSYVWPNPQPLQQTYEGEITYLKTWLKNRIVWMDSAIGMTCNPVFVSNPDPIAQEGQWQLWPNPTSRQLYVAPPFNKSIQSIRILSTDGKLVASFGPETIAPSGATTLDIRNLAQGLYLTQIIASDGVVISRRIMKQ